MEDITFLHDKYYSWQWFKGNHSCKNRLFLEGLKKYGKGDWRSISRLVVKTRTSTQVASHAQKYFLRHSCLKKDRKRSSIHDITTTANPVPPPTNFPTQGGNSPENQNLGFPMWRLRRWKLHFLLLCFVFFFN